MYLKRARIQNVRSLTDLAWEIDEKQAAGWHVILGDNGAGKSTFVRAVALALIGPNGAQKLSEDWATWLAPGGTQGRIELNLLHNEQIDGVRTPDKEEENRARAMLTTMQAIHENAVQVVTDKIYKFPSATLLFKRSADDYVALGWDSRVENTILIILCGAGKRAGSAWLTGRTAASRAAIRSMITSSTQTQK